MSASTAWFVTVVLLLGGVLVLHHLGWDVAASVQTALHGVEHLLGHPIVVG